MWAPTNPFAWDMATLEDVNNGSEQQQQSVAVGTADNAGGSGGVLFEQHLLPTRLPYFWPHAPAMWFARVECRFEMMGIAGERQRFCCVADSLPYESLRLVADLVASPPADRPYSILKDRLLLAHALTPVQKAEKLFAMPQLGDRRPSDLLAAMYEFCPPGEENSALFQALFLTRLPPEIRVHVEGAEKMALKELAAKADQLWLTLAAKADQLWLTLAAKQQALLAAAMAAEAAPEDGEELLAAVKGKFFPRKKQQSKKESQAASAAPPKGRPADKRLVTLQLCWRHAKYGETAYNCNDQGSCQWPGN
jgi:hypothetical protein